MHYGTADEASVSFTYDSNDNPASYTDELGRVTSFTYDDLNRLIETDLPAPDPNNPTVFPVISDVYNALRAKRSPRRIRWAMSRNIATAPSAT